MDIVETFSERKTASSCLKNNSYDEIKFKSLVNTCKCIQVEFVRIYLYKLIDFLYQLVVDREHQQDKIESKNVFLHN